MPNNQNFEVRISAILPNYNSSQFLSKSIQSLLDQKEKFTEIIVVDDGSTDGSLLIINKFMQKYEYIRLIKHEKNEGVIAALNTGIRQAVGDYLMLAAADDWYDEKFIALAKLAIQECPGVGIICGDSMIFRYTDKSYFRRMMLFPKKNTLITPEEFKSVIKQYYIGFNGGGIVMKRQAVLDVGMLHSELRWHCDWLLYFVLAMKYGIYYIDEVFVYINSRQEGYSEGRRSWHQQKPVLQAIINKLSQRYPDLWNDFKRSALLPCYELHYIFLFVCSPKARRFFTIKLLRRLLLNNAIIVYIGRLFPYRFILQVRKLLKA